MHTSHIYIQICVFLYGFFPLINGMCSLLGAIGLHYAHLRLGLGLGSGLGLGLVLGLGVGLALVFSEI